MKSHGRGTTGKRGIGSGKGSHKTSSSTSYGSGMKKTKGNGMGGKAGSVKPKKGGRASSYK